MKTFQQTPKYVQRRKKSPIEYIKEGILKSNWETVCEGYERLTGEALSLPATSPTDRDALQQIYDIVAMAVEEPGYVPSNTISELRSSTIKAPKRKKTGRSKKSETKNTVTTDGEDSSIDLDNDNKTITQKETGGTRLITNEPDPEEVEKNKIRAKRVNKIKSKLDRPVAETYKVKCSECEKSFKSDRPQGEMGQKCKECLNDKKGIFS